jgi:hypothetical protein
MQAVRGRDRIVVGGDLPQAANKKIIILRTIYGNANICED